MGFDKLSDAGRKVLLETADKHGKSHDGVWYNMPAPWRQRSSVVAAWIGPQAEKFSAFTDIGCGSMLLRTLVPHLKYVPCDFASRSEDTIVVDLNNETLPVTGTSAATALGVIEYLYDLLKFIQSLRQYKNVVLSYNHRSIRESRMRRITHFWVNHLGRREFRRMLESNGFRVVRWRFIKFAEVLYQLERVD